MPTFLGYSERDVGVIAGGGISGYGGIVLHEPTESEFHRVVMDPKDETAGPKGIGFNYDHVATITVSGLLKWTNATLSRAPRGRQDIRETGPLRIEVFDNEDQRRYLEENSRLLEKLGIQFIG